MKEIAGRFYLHVYGLSELETPLLDKVEHAISLADVQIEIDFNVVKIDREGNTISLLSYPEFFASGFPALQRSWAVNFYSKQIVRRNYADSLNPPILHRKELLLPTSHPDRPKFEALTRDAEALGLFDNATMIGFCEPWEQLVASRGYRVTEHSLVPVANVEFEGDVEGTADASAQIFRHKTALARYNVSAPVQALLRHDLVKTGTSFFDYGCGQGDDVRSLRSLGIEANGWDPHFASAEPRVAADIVNIGFVINVIEDFGERVEALQTAYSLSRRVLSVATMLAAGGISMGRSYRDGYISSRNTFQKYYSQSELAGFISHVLDEEPVPVSPGVFFVFRDKSLEQQFLAGRDRSRGFSDRLRRIEKRQRLERPRAAVKQRLDKYDVHAEELEQLWGAWVTLGRSPDDEEVPNAAALCQAFGSVKRASRFLERHKDPTLQELARTARKNDLLVHFALQQFRSVPRYRQLETRLQRDVKEFFGDYATAQAEAMQLLSSARSPENIHAECVAAAERGLGWMDEDHSLQLQTSLVQRLSPLLRAYIGCGAMLYGDIESADLLKIHIRSGKLTLMQFDNFLENPLPRMVERVKVNLRSQEVDVFKYQDGFEPPYLYFKSRFIDDESPRYADQVALEAQLEEAGLLNFSGYGPTAEEFDRMLSRQRLEIHGPQLVRSLQVPDLDAQCGERLTFRQLIECGETQRETGIANLPSAPETYNALFDLAVNILDPVIEYFGPIELTYCFASAALTKRIQGRIEPKLDQHTSHERNAKGVHICDRLGAAVDFIVRDEDMLEVAEWIATNLPFDRIYFYDRDRPLHVSYGPEQSREFVEMRLTGKGKRIPYVRRLTSAL